MKYSVWPTSVPPVCTARWDQDSWQRFEAHFRPETYKGGQYDQAEWDTYRADVDEIYRRNQLEKYTP